MTPHRLLLLLPFLLLGCAQPGTDESSLSLLNRLPEGIAGFNATGPARIPGDTRMEIAVRVYQMAGARALVTLGRTEDGQAVPTGPEAPPAQKLVETLAMAAFNASRATGAPGFGPFRRETNKVVSQPDGPTLRCAVLRRPIPQGAQGQYFCATGLFQRILYIHLVLNHGPADSEAAQTLGARLASQVARMLASGQGLLPAALVTGPPKTAADAAPAAEDDAVPDPNQ